MASPQTENGFTKLANEILEVLSTVKMSGSEWQYVMCLFRKTYGFNKKEDWVTNSQVVKMTGLKKERVSEAKGRLLARNIVTEKRNRMAFQKDWEKWIELRKSVTAVTEKRNDLLRKSVHTKEKKETITKDIGESKASQPLKGKKTMKKNKLGRYIEDGHNEYETAIDIDSGEEVPDSFEEQTAVNKKVTELIEWAEGVRKKPFLDRPTQRKMIHDLRKADIHPDEVKKTFLELLGSDFWKEQKRLPDFKTVFSSLKNKK